jgi:hypothetical protein
MGRWLWMLGGLLIWAGHFLGVYGIASVAATVSRADDAGWRALGLGFSAVCAVGCLILLGVALFRQRRDGGTERFQDQLAGLGAGLATIAIVWQALPTVVGY